MMEEELIITPELKQRYFIHLAYDGTGYCGWQMQNNGDTVQARLNNALSQLLNERITSMGCGRTDAGVHASSFYAHFDTDKPLPSRCEDRINSLLPKDIEVFKIFAVDNKAHTRFHATSRTYEYYMHFHKSPFLRAYSTHIHYRDTNWEKVFEATSMLTSFKDFTSLCRPSEDFKTNICDLSEARWDRIKRPPFAGNTEDEFMRFTISSNRFLRGMVRKIVGTLMLVGNGKVSVEEFYDVVSQQKELKKTSLAPPQGLYLTQIKYPFID